MELTKSKLKNEIYYIQNDSDLIIFELKNLVINFIEAKQAI